jgi:hypothetical protein
VVSKTELDDDEFDVVDREGPSAANGVVHDLDSALGDGWEDDE